MDKIVHRAEFGQSADDRRRAVVGAVVEDAADVEIGIGRLFESGDEFFALRSATDDDGAAGEAAFSGPAFDLAGQNHAEGDQ